MKLNQDFKELLKLFNEHGVSYLLIDGIPVLMHGHVRNTVDLDLAVSPDQQNAERIVRALSEFGFGSADLSTDLFTTENSLIRMGNPPVRIEILNYLEGLDFKEAYKRRDVVDRDGIKIDLISREDLITNKKAVGRHKDLADVEELEAK